MRRLWHRFYCSRLLTLFCVPIFVLLVSGAHSNAQGDAYFVRHPSGQVARFVFEYNEHVWLQEGGTLSRRITNQDAIETGPALSPDGSRVAYVGVHGITTEIYLAQVATGEPIRLTADGGFDSRIVGWLDDSRLLYSTTIKSKKRGPLLFVLDVNTRQASPVPLAEASEGCVSGESFVFVKNEKLLDNNRLYRGGYAQSIYRIPLSVLMDGPVNTPRADIKVVPLTSSYRGISREPLCSGDRVYFLSDRSGRFNIWSMDTNGRDLVQHTHEKQFDIGSMSISPKEPILYQQLGEVYSFDPTSGQTAKLKISMPHGAAGAADFLAFDANEASEIQVSDDAELALFVIRGNLWSVDVAGKRATCIECSPAARVKSVHLASKEAVFALWDVDGEYGIFSFNTKSGQATRIPTDVNEPIEDISVSPDGKTMLLTSTSGQLFVQATATGRARRLSVKSKTVPRWATWSPDSKHFALVTYTPQDIGRIVLADINCGTTTDISSGAYESYFPAFSDDGGRLYYISETNFRSTTTDPWAPRNYWPDYQSRGLIYSIDLKSLENGNQEHSALNRKVQADDGGCAVTSSRMTRSARQVQLATQELPVVAANYALLFWAQGRPYAMLKRVGRDEKGKLVDFPSTTDRRRQAARMVFDDDLYKLEFSANKRSLIAIGRNGPFAAKLPADDTMPKKISLAGLQSLMVPIDMSSEYGQMFQEIWRYYRDYFWDPKMNGVDWAAARRKYQPFLSKVSNRTEFNEVVSSMISELGAGHTSLRSPVSASSDEQEAGKLGASFVEEAGGLRVADVYDGDLDVMEERSPLSLANPILEVGDLISKVNGTAVHTQHALDEVLAGTAGRAVPIEIKRMDGSIAVASVDVISAPAEAFLRYRHWTYMNKAMVSELSDHQVGYLHLNASYEKDMATIVREYPSMQDNTGIIIDLRGNNGGNIDSWILNFLQRRTWMYLNGRYDPLLYKNPRDSFDGKIVALIDGDTYSNGELIAEGIRRLKLGVLIGTRTSGAGIWVNSSRTLVDGGPVRVPENGSYVKDHHAVRWLIEGEGVKPDIVVENDPYQFFYGEDAQLKAAVNYILHLKTSEP